MHFVCLAMPTALTCEVTTCEAAHRYGIGGQVRWRAVAPLGGALQRGESITCLHSVAFSSPLTACGPVATTGGGTSALVCASRPCVRTRMRHGAVCAAPRPQPTHPPWAVHSWPTAFSRGMTAYGVRAVPM